MSTYPFPAELQGVESEEDYNDWLSGVFRRFGWDVEQEVQSDDRTARADLIISHDIWGKLGVECKFQNRIRPRNWATALKQVQRYADHQFNGEQLESWAISVAEPVTEEKDEFMHEFSRALDFREFMNVMDVGVVRMDRRIEIIFNNSNPLVKIPVCDIHHTDGQLYAPAESRLEECVNREAVEYVSGAT